MNFLVTGASGFIGWFLVDRLLADGHVVTAWMRKAERHWPDADLAIETPDLQDASVVAAALTRAAPDIVIHLAAQSLPTRSWSEPTQTFHTNIDSTINILEALRLAGAKGTRMLFASSSAIYTRSKSGTPISEDAVLDPDSPYGISKLAAEKAVQLYTRAYGLDALCFRPFSWIGARKEGDAASDIARRIVAIECGAPPLLKTGRIDAIRDIIDVRDGVSGLLTLVEHGETGTAYNICSGTGTSIENMIDGYRKIARMGFETKLDSELLRPIDEPVRVGNPSRIFSLGWRPEFTLNGTLREILEYWRNKNLK